MTNRWDKRINGWDKMTNGWDKNNKQMTQINEWKAQNDNE